MISFKAFVSCSHANKVCFISPRISFRRVALQVPTVVKMSCTPHLEQKLVKLWCFKKPLNTFRYVFKVMLFKNVSEAKSLRSYWEVYLWSLTWYAYFICLFRLFSSKSKSRKKNLFCYEKKPLPWRLCEKITSSWSNLTQWEIVLLLPAFYQTGIANQKLKFLSYF